MPRVVVRASAAMADHNNQTEASMLALALARDNQERTFEALLNPPGLEETAPSSSRLHDLTLHKLSNSGEWKERRLIVTRTGQLFICAAAREHQKQGMFLKRSRSHLNKSGYVVQFFERHFVLEDTCLKYWKDAAAYRANPDKPKGIISLSQSEITIVEQPHSAGFAWFLVEHCTGEIWEFAHTTAAEREEWLKAASVNLEIAAKEDLLDSIPCLEITEVSKLENDVSTLAAFGKAELPSELSSYLSSPSYRSTSQTTSDSPTKRHRRAASSSSNKRSSLSGVSSQHFFEEGAEELPDTPSKLPPVQIHAGSHKQFAIQSALDHEHEAHIVRDLAIDSGCGLIGYNKSAITNFSYSPGQTFGFTIKTVPAGYNSGRVFIFRASDSSIRDECISVVMDACNHAKQAEDHHKKRKLLQAYAQRLVKNSIFKILVAGMILATFFLAVTESQLRPKEGSPSFQVFQRVDSAFTYFFMCELVINMAAFWFWEFWGDGWFVFDTLIVTMSVIEMLFADVPGVKQLRILRSFRVFRAFGRLKQLKNIINAVVASVPPLFNAAAIILLVMGIFGTVSVEMFGDEAPEEFATFFRAFYTLFGVIAYGRWPDDKLSSFDDQGRVVVKRVAFVYIYVVVVVIVLLQVVVAVLLDNFFKVSQQQEEDAMALQKEQEKKLDSLLSQKERYHLDPYMKYLCRNFVSELDIYARIEKMWNFLDSDRSGTISFLEFSEGIFRLNAAHAHGTEGIHRMTLEEYLHLTQDLVNEDGELDRPKFQKLVLRRLKLYIQRQAADAVKYHESQPDIGALLSSTKYLLACEVLGKNKDGGAARLGASDQEEPGADIFLHSPPANTRMGRRPAELDPAARRQSDTLYRLLDSQVEGLSCSLDSIQDSPGPSIEPQIDKLEKLLAVAKRREEQRQKVQAGSSDHNSNARLRPHRSSLTRVTDASNVTTATAMIGFANSKMMSDAWSGPTQTAQHDQGDLLRAPQPRQETLVISNSAITEAPMATIRPPPPRNVTFQEERVDDFQCEYRCGYSGTYDAVFQHEKICALRPSSTNPAAVERAINGTGGTWAHVLD